MVRWAGTVGRLATLYPTCKAMARARDRYQRMREDVCALAHVLQEQNIAAAPGVASQSS